MKFSLSWLKGHIETNALPHEIADKLTNIGLEVEGVTNPAELLGSGMVHPRVIANCGLDPDEWQGFAFGCGIDRLAMLKYGMDDLRAFFDGDLRWMKHYGFRFLDVPTLSGGVGA